MKKEADGSRGKRFIENMRPYTPKRLCFATVGKRCYEVWRTPDARGGKHYHLYAFEGAAQTLRLAFATEISARAEFERRVERAARREGIA